MEKSKMGKEGALGKTKVREYPMMIDGYLRQLLEVNSQMDALRHEQERIIRLLLPDVKPELSFDDHRRRIYWSGGSVKLGKKSFLFIKTLWQGERHRAEIAELEENVWTQHTETGAFVARRTISMLVRYTEKNLTEANFPYKIEPLKNRFRRELEGFRLILRHNQKKALPSKKEDVV